MGSLNDSSLNARNSIVCLGINLASLRDFALNPFLILFITPSGESSPTSTIMWPIMFWVHLVSAETNTYLDRIQSLKLQLKLLVYSNNLNLNYKYKSVSVTNTNQTYLLISEYFTKTAIDS